MTIAKYRPQAFHSPFNHFVTEFLGRDISHLMGNDDLRSSTPSVNIIERETSFELRLLAPGFSKEDLKLSVEDDKLTIAAERKKEEVDRNERFTRREFVHNAFSRSFNLPKTVSTEKISAEFVNGVLHVSIPKAEVSRPKSRDISIA